MILKRQWNMEESITSDSDRLIKVLSSWKSFSGTEFGQVLLHKPVWLGVDWLVAVTLSMDQWEYPWAKLHSVVIFGKESRKDGVRSMNQSGLCFSDRYRRNWSTVWYQSPVTCPSDVIDSKPAWNVHQAITIQTKLIVFEVEHRFNELNFRWVHYFVPWRFSSS